MPPTKTRFVESTGTDGNIQVAFHFSLGGVLIFCGVKAKKNKPKNNTTRTTGVHKQPIATLYLFFKDRPPQASTRIGDNEKRNAQKIMSTMALGHCTAHQNSLARKCLLVLLSHYPPSHWRTHAKSLFKLNLEFRICHGRIIAYLSEQSLNALLKSTCKLVTVCTETLDN